MKLGTFRKGIRNKDLMMTTFMSLAECCFYPGQFLQEKFDALLSTLLIC